MKGVRERQGTARPPTFYKGGNDRGTGGGGKGTPKSSRGHAQRGAGKRQKRAEAADRGDGKAGMKAWVREERDEGSDTQDSLEKKN